METEQELKELDEKLETVVIKKTPLWKRLLLLLLIIGLIILGYFLK